VVSQIIGKFRATFLPSLEYATFIRSPKVAQPSSSSRSSTTMANTSRSVAELPRFLLPQLTWKSFPVKGAVSQIRSTRHSKQRPRIPSFKQPAPLRTAKASLSSTLSCCQSARSESLQIRPRSTSQTCSTDAAPIRHNGVYVAAFKPARRAFSTSRALKKDHHFDTLKFVQRLRGEGFSEEQAVAMMHVLNDVIEESIQNLTRTMVLKEGECLAEHRRRMIHVRCRRVAETPIANS
jgi:Protein of unknown function (DUF1640)